MNTKINANLIKDEELKELIANIADETASIIASTYGPYGRNTFIHTMDRVYATKDGWNVLDHIRLGRDVVHNSLKKLIQDCAQSVLITVGDGTSTTVIGASVLNRRVISYLKEHPGINSKEIENALTKAVSVICDEIQNNVEYINEDNMESVIRRIALVSTNWDENMADIITDIYKTTHNPIIKIQNSGVEETYTTYIDGYDIAADLQLPNYYLTDRENCKCELEKPVVLVLNYTVPTKLSQGLAMIGALAGADGKSLVVAAPDFEKSFIDSLITQNMAALRQNQQIVNIVPVKYIAGYKVDKDCVEDLCVLLGTDFIARENNDMDELFQDLIKTMLVKVPSIDSFETEEEYNITYANNEAAKQQMAMAAYQFLLQVSGTCEKITITDKYLLASGLTNKTENMLNQRIDKLKYELDAKIKDATALSMITDDIRVKRVRLGKLQCHMGIINVGGFGDAILKAKRDAIDDATKACEAAYRDGYIMGGGLAIPYFTTKLINTTEVSDENEMVLDCIKIIKEAFVDVMKTMYANKYFDADKSDVIAKAIEDGTPFNLITEEYDEDIVEPVNVNTEVLKGTMRLVLTMATSNQLLFNQYESTLEVSQQ
jgi:chaperonin GroEL (HSP60 family)